MQRKTLATILKNYHHDKSKAIWADRLCLFSRSKDIKGIPNGIAQLQGILSSVAGPTFTKEEQFNILRLALELEFSRKNAFHNVHDVVKFQQNKAPFLVWMPVFDVAVLSQSIRDYVNSQVNLSLRGGGKAFVITSDKLHFFDPVDLEVSTFNLDANYLTQLKRAYKIEETLLVKVMCCLTDPSELSLLEQAAKMQANAYRIDHESYAAMTGFPGNDSIKFLNMDPIIQEFGDDRYALLVNLFNEGKLNLKNFEAVMSEDKPMNRPRY